MLRIDNLNAPDGGNSGVQSAKTIKQEKLSSLFAAKNTQAAGNDNGLQLEHGKNSNYKAFNDAIKESCLGNQFMDAKSLEAKGWKKSSIMDMNGGVYYTDPNTGASVRVQEDKAFQKSNTYRTENMSHHEYYDDKGKPTNGIVQVRQADGSIKVYEYEYDVDGNKFIKSVKTSEFDYFANYD